VKTIAPSDCSVACSLACSSACSVGERFGFLESLQRVSLRYAQIASQQVSGAGLISMAYHPGLKAF
jgi:hypothetical protein